MRDNEKYCKLCGRKFEKTGISTGYGINSNNEKICTICCGKLDAKELEKSGKLHGYFSNGYFTNWPGTFKIKATCIRKSYHNMAGRDGRSDFWLTYKDKQYWGVQIGKYSDCATIKLIKG